jgi:hypothetical protein
VMMMQPHRGRGRPRAGRGRGVGRLQHDLTTIGLLNSRRNSALMSLVQSRLSPAAVVASGSPFAIPSAMAAAPAPRAIVAPLPPQQPLPAQPQPQPLAWNQVQRGGKTLVGPLVPTAPVRAVANSLVEAKRPRTAVAAPASAARPLPTAAAASAATAAVLDDRKKQIRALMMRHGLYVD